jgi:Domain of unknown function (DUF4926)
LQSWLVELARSGEAVPGRVDAYGKRFAISGILSYKGRQAWVAHGLDRASQSRPAGIPYSLRGPGASRLSVFKEFDVVALLRDRPDLGARRGWVGTLLLQVGDGVWEVEFSDDAGRTKSIAAIPAGELLVLDMHPVPA